MSIENLMEDSSKNFNFFKDIKISRFKPPFIWHFPIERLREIQKKNNSYEIGTRSVDFKQIYKDGRVDTFLKKFEAMFDKNMIVMGYSVFAQRDNLLLDPSKSGSGYLDSAMRIEGMEPPRTIDNAAIKAAFSTVSLPGILSNVANKKLMQAYEAQPIIATKLCTTGDLTDFKENQRFRLTDIGDLKPVGADGEIKDGGVSEEKAVNQLDTYAKKFCLTRKMIINDDLGAFLKVPTAMGNRAARLVDQLFFKRLMANPTCVDGKPLFGRDHKNLLSGANSALSADSLKKAIQTFTDQVDSDGQPINVEPSILLVPTSLKFLAQELTQGTTLIMSGGPDNVVRPAINVLADENLRIVSSPYLSNSKYPGSSEASWYLFGKPGVVDTFEIGYLKGKRTPTVERGDLDFNVLGIWFRVFFDIGIREQDHRGMVKATGSAA